MRLFIAINFDAPTAERMLAVQHRLLQLGRGDFSRPENLHLTLAFLGEVAPERLSDVRSAMDETPVPSLTLCFDHAGRFKRSDGDIWWLGLAENPALARLHTSLSLRLADRGFQPEARPFSPHITLARRFRAPIQPDLDSLPGIPLHTKAEAITLMRSHRVSRVLTYTPQYEVRAGVSGP